MTDQFLVCEIQNQAVVPYVFQVTNGDITAAEHSAKAKYHQIMVTAYGSTVTYHGAMIVRMRTVNDRNEMFITDYEVVERAV